MVAEWIDQTDYPQAPAMDEAGLMALFEATEFARLGTINADGTVHMTPIYFLYEQGQIVMASQVPSRKIRNIKRNSQVTVLIDVTDPVYRGALIYGTAELSYDNIIDQRIAIFNRTRSRDIGEAYARKLLAKWDCAIIRVTPERIASFDYTASTIT